MKQFRIIWNNNSMRFIWAENISAARELSDKAAQLEGTSTASVCEEREIRHCPKPGCSLPLGHTRTCWPGVHE